MRIILHYLEKSEAHRILWLLEELNVPYEAIFYRRDHLYNAPVELKLIHPLGTSPVIEAILPDDNKQKVIAESAHIMRFLLHHFDKAERLSFSRNSLLSEQMDYMIHYAEATLQPLENWLLNKTWVVSNTPYGFQTIVKWAVGVFGGDDHANELIRNLDYLNSILSKQEEKGHSYLVGNKFSLADMMVAYPILQGFCYSPEIFYNLDGGTYDAGKQFPCLYRWSKLCQKHQLLCKANEIVVELSRQSRSVN